MPSPGPLAVQPISPPHGGPDADRAQEKERKKRRYYYAQQSQNTEGLPIGWLNGWMGGGMWVWTVVGILLVILLAVLIGRATEK
jgi:uncharacterized integral membrane protein